MKKQVYETMPEKFETKSFVGILVTIFRFNITETEDGYECDEAEYSHSNPLTEDDYAPMVSSLVRAKYSADEVEAITLNYVASKTTENKKDWQALQAWRTEVKAIAKEAIGIAE